MKKFVLPLLLLGLSKAVVATDLAPTAPWRPEHTVIVVLENLSAHEATGSQRRDGKAPVYDNPAWSFINELARRGALFSQAYFGQTPYGSGLPTRPSQPNYLFLFSGHHQGVLPSWFSDEHSPYPGTAWRDGQGQPLPQPRPGKVGVANNVVPSAWLPLTSPNLGAAILSTGGSFASFSESLPYPSWNCATDSRLVPCDSPNAPSDDYRRKHNPAINWTDQIRPGGKRGRRGDPNHHVLPVATNLGFEPTHDPVLQRTFRGFAKDAQGLPLSFDKLPSVSIVIPNEQHDAHSNGAAIADEWLRQALGAYAEWAMTHNSLLIVTFDEDGSTNASHGNPYQLGAHPIPTIFFGAKVKPGVYGQRIDHLNVLSTVLWLHGALDRFKADFRRHYGVTEGAGGEAEREYLNLKPVVGVWQAGEH